MKAIIRYFIRYPIWVNLVLLIFVVGGFISLSNMKSSFFAPIDPRTISIQLTYPGASPTEIEEGIILKIEDKLTGIQGIDRTTSTSRENAGTITIEVQKGADGNIVLQDVKNAVDSINSFPTDMEPPVVYKLPIQDFAFRLSLTGDVPLEELYATAKRVERDLLNMEGISLVKMSAVSAPEIQITLSNTQLEQYNLTMDEIAAKIKAQNQEITGGTLKTPNRDIQIRSNQKRYHADELNTIIITHSKTGNPIRLSDIATLKDDWSEDPNTSFYNGSRSIILTIDKTTEEDILHISTIVNQYIKSFNTENTAIKANVIRDRRIILKQRVSLLTKNGIMGFLLVIGLLAFFLSPRLAFWVASSIPIAFLGLFIVGYQIGMTINVISLFGMIVVVGILVDDGIVIGENIYQEYEKGSTPFQAAINGTLTVLPSVFSAVLTTVIAFTPFYFLDGRIADIMNNMATVVIVTLLVSLLESAFILPSHLAHSKGLTQQTKKTKLNQIGQEMMEWMRDKLYRPVLNFSIHHYYVVFIIPFLMLLITIGGLKGGIIKSTFFPFVDGDDISITVSMPSGTPEAITMGIMNDIEQKAWDVNREFKAKRKDHLDVITVITKEQSGKANEGTLNLTLLDGETRNMESFEITQAIRKAVGTQPKAKSITFGGTGFFGKAISISLLSNNLDELTSAKEALSNQLSQLSSLRDVSDTDEQNTNELDIQLKPTAYALGFTPQIILSQIRQQIFGTEAQRIQWGDDEVKIWVKLNTAAKDSIGDLANLKIKSPQGNWVPLTEIAALVPTKKSLTINHVNGQREIKVEANLANDRDPVPPILSTITHTILPDILKQFPSVTYGLDGQKRQTDKTVYSAKLVIPTVLFLIYAIIALTFRSFNQALVVFLLIPISLVGMAWGHFIHSMAINMLSIFGFIALIGILVNDSIVYISTFNMYLKEGYSIDEGLLKTGLTRFRPILLTSLTTIFGLGPLIFEKSRQAQFLIPMAISVAYGLLFVTFVNLICLPGMIKINNIIRFKLHNLFASKRLTPEGVEPAILEDIDPLTGDWHEDAVSRDNHLSVHTYQLSSQNQSSKGPSL